VKFFELLLRPDYMIYVQVRKCLERPQDHFQHWFRLNQHRDNQSPQNDLQEHYHSQLPQHHNQQKLSLEVQENHSHNRLSQNHIARESVNTIECQQINGFVAVRRNPLFRRSAKPHNSSNAIYSPISLLNEGGQTSTFKSVRAIEQRHSKK
jgi:hypothetical protein